MIPRLDIILVNRNSRNDLRQCLTSIAEAQKDRFNLARVCIVDDDSSDDSLLGLAQCGRLPLEIIRQETRSGYGSSCNVGAKGSTAEYLLFLNTDIILGVDSLSQSVAFLEQQQNRDVGIVGIKMLENSGQVSRSCARFPTPGRYVVLMLGLERLLPTVFLGHHMNEWDHLETREVDQVIGAFLLTRRALFEELGGYDDRFFVYMEDLDLSLRARSAGHKSVYLAGTYAYHKGGATAKKARGESLFFNLRSRMQYAVKHFSAMGASVVVLETLFAEPLARLTFATFKGSLVDVRATMGGYGRLFGWLATVATTRLLKRP